MSDKNLWGNLDDLGRIKTPTTHLKEQADLLAEGTNKVLEAEVETGKTDGDVTVTLAIVAPALNRYSYTVLRVNHGVEIYPLTLSDIANNQSYRCDTEEKFLGSLETVLTSTKVRKILRSLVSQSES